MSDNGVVWQKPHVISGRLCQSTPLSIQLFLVDSLDCYENTEYTSGTLKPKPGLYVFVIFAIFPLCVS